MERERERERKPEEKDRTIPERPQFDENGVSKYIFPADVPSLVKELLTQAGEQHTTEAQREEALDLILERPQPYERIAFEYLNRADLEAIDEKGFHSWVQEQCHEREQTKPNSLEEIEIPADLQRYFDSLGDGMTWRPAALHNIDANTYQLRRVCEMDDESKAALGVSLPDYEEVFSADSKEGLFAQMRAAARERGAIEDWKRGCDWHAIEDVTPDPTAVFSYDVPSLVKELLPQAAEPPRKISPLEYMMSNGARQEFARQEAAEARREEAIEHIVDIAAARQDPFDRADFDHLNRADLEAIEEKGFNQWVAYQALEREQTKERER